MKIVTDNLTSFYVANGPWIKFVKEYCKNDHVRLYRPVSCNGVTCFGIMPDAIPTLERFCEEYNIEVITVPMGTVYYRGRKFEKLMSVMSD